jgi:hypothetical protein
MQGIVSLRVEARREKGAYVPNELLLSSVRLFLL